jgi:hypothetical protein
MNAVFRFTHELESLLSDIAFSGLKNVHPGTLEKIALLEGTVGELGMGKGASLLKEFAEALRTYRLGEANNSDLAALLCNLDFYNKNIIGNSEPVQ